MEVRRLHVIFCLGLGIIIAVSGCSSMSTGRTSDLDAEFGGLSEQDIALRRYGSGNIPYAEAEGVLKNVHFDYDSSTIRSEDYQILERNAEILKSNAKWHTEIEGHCDRRGTNEYNLALGERRARSVASLLANLGVAAEQMSIISYGEEIPLDPADNETAYAKNRRVHFAVFPAKK
jgi:peptidoglycan-associated lipoprotein